MYEDMAQSGPDHTRIAYLGIGTSPTSFGTL
jgi:hypothetical protein